MHPKIKELVEMLQKHHMSERMLSQDSLAALRLLKENNSTSTEAVISLHQGFNLPMKNAEEMVQSSNLWEIEHIQDIAYQTFLYMSYDS